jgi:hypothetical protein
MFFLVLKVNDENRIEGSGSISQRHGSADPDPDPHQNVMHTEHCCKASVSGNVPHGNRNRIRNSLSGPEIKHCHCSLTFC